MNDMRSRTTPDAVIRAALTLDPPNGLADVVGRNIALAVATTTQRRAVPRSWPRALAPSGFAPFYAPMRFRVISIAVALALLLLVSVAMIVFIGSRPRLPAPFGLAKPGLIAFDSGGDIFVSNADGTDRRQLTSGSATDLQPTWSHDGTKLAYLSLSDPPMIARDLTTPTEELIVIDADGTHRAVIGTKPGTGSAYDDPYHYGSGASWSPDDSQLVYAGRIDGIERIFVTRADGTGSRMTGDEAVQGQDPIWSPDGKRIAFHGGSNDNDRGIYLMNADGTDMRRLIALPDSYSPITWSPDGRAIAFTKRPGPEGQEIWVVDVDDGAARMISNATDVNDAPAWSPDGSWLAYYTMPKPYLPNGRFVIVRPDGSGETVLTPLVASGPAWSPDGRNLVGIAYQDAATAFQHSIAVIDIADGTATVLQRREAIGSSGDDVKGIASWQRLAD